MFEAYNNAGKKQLTWNRFNILLYTISSVFRVCPDYSNKHQSQPYDLKFGLHRNHNGEWVIGRSSNIISLNLATFKMLRTYEFFTMDTNLGEESMIQFEL